VPFSYICINHKTNIMTNIQQEIWKDILNYEGLYKVSNKGNVLSLECVVIHKNGQRHIKNQRLLSKGINKRGYESVGLYKNGEVQYFKVHRLVAIAFIPNHNNYPQVNHINSDKIDNNVINLEWCTQKENNIHSRVFGNRDMVKDKETARELGYKRKKIMLDTLTGVYYESVEELFTSMGICRASFYNKRRVGLYSQYKIV